MGFLGGGGGTKWAATLYYDETCKLLWAFVHKNFRNSTGLGFYRVQVVSSENMYMYVCFAYLKLNSDSTRICIHLVVKVKSPRHIFLQLHIFMFFFLSIPPSFLLFWAVLTPLKHSTPLSAMFVYIHPLPHNLINARAPSSGHRLSLFFEVSYLLPYLDLTTC